MPHHLASEQEIYDWLTNDFESAWNTLAQFPEKSLGRGNFTFALQATILLEFASSLCEGDSVASTDFSAELHRLRPRYFLTLPGKSNNVGVKLPHRGNHETQLLTFMFDMIRNGQAHRYQQISGDLTDGGTFGITLTGAHHNQFLSQLLTPAREHAYLRLLPPDGTTVRWLYVDPGIFFLDIKCAIDNTRLLYRGLTVEPMHPRLYAFGTADLEIALS